MITDFSKTQAQTWEKLSTISNSDKIPSWKVRNSNSHYIESLKDNLLFNFKNGGILKDNHQKNEGHDELK